MQTLAEIVNLKKGAQFRYKGEPATVLNVRNCPKEDTGSLFDAPATDTVHFIYGSLEMHEVVLHSMHPNPKVVKLQDYSF